MIKPSTACMACGSTRDPIRCDPHVECVECGSSERVDLGIVEDILRAQEKAYRTQDRKLTRALVGRGGTDHPFGPDAFVERREGRVYVDGLSQIECFKRLRRRGQEAGNSNSEAGRLTATAIGDPMKDCMLTPGQERAARRMWSAMLRQMQTWSADLERRIEYNRVILDYDLL